MLLNYPAGQWYHDADASIWIMSLAIRIMMQGGLNALNGWIQPAMVTALVSAFIWYVWLIAYIIFTCGVENTCIVCKAISGKMSCFNSNLLQLAGIEI